MQSPPSGSSPLSGCRGGRGGRGRARGDGGARGPDLRAVRGLSSGRITLRYNRNAGQGRPVVAMDPRYGKATFQVVRWSPGLLVVAFQSPNGTLNTVPGRIVGIDLRTRATAQIGTETQVSLDPAGTWLMAKNGKKLPLRMEGGTIVFE